MTTTRPLPTYRGHRREDGTTCVTCDGGPFAPQLAGMLDWGHRGLGALLLAFALLLEMLGGDEDRAERLHRGLRDDVIAHLPETSWEMPARVLHDWLASRGEVGAAR